MSKRIKTLNLNIYEQFIKYLKSEEKKIKLK